MSARNIHWIILKIKNSPSVLFFLLTLAVGLIVLWPLHDFQYYLAQGDHGRDLYCFKKTFEGSLTYRDYTWFFGPLMPYYYSLCYWIGGVSIQSVLVGQGILILLTGLVIYAACVTFLSPALSFLCAFWYWSSRGAEFFYTYNHSGGLLALIATLTCVLYCIKTSRLNYAANAYFCAFMLALIRLNMGIAVLACLTLSLWIIDVLQRHPQRQARMRRYIFWLIMAIGGAVVIYALLLSPLADYAIYQTFPYEKAQRTDFSPSLFYTLRLAVEWTTAYFTATLPRKFFGVLLLIATGQSLLFLTSTTTPAPERKKTLLILITLLFFAVFTAHEFIASGVYYRLFWVIPLLILLIFFVLGTGTRGMSSPAVKILLWVTLALPALLNINREILNINSYKIPSQKLTIGQNKVYTLQHPYWLQTVAQAVDFLQKNTTPKDKILVLPLDPLYLFLSGRDSASRQLVFFEHINIPENQERDIIQEMESHHGNWIVLSNRAFSTEPGLGFFGKDYCPLLFQYARKNFISVARFGDWTNPPGWAWNHGVEILKRK